MGRVEASLVVSVSWTDLSSIIKLLPPPHTHTRKGFSLAQRALVVVGEGFVQSASNELLHRLRRVVFP